MASEDARQNWEDVREVAQLIRTILLCYPEAINRRKRIDGNYIKGIHLHAMKGLIFNAIDVGGPGEYRRCNVRVGRYYPPHYLSIGEQMHRLCKFLKKVQDGVNNHVSPIIHAAITHYWFEKIHPFADGNGRTGRVLMNLILLWHGYPPCIIEVEKRWSYYDSLGTDRDITELVVLMLDMLDKTRADKRKDKDIKGLLP